MVAAAIRTNRGEMAQSPEAGLSLHESAGKANAANFG
jgi:hypothetical protein